jgi:hypothetical protein
MKKLNGEAAHLGACRIGDIYYRCAGSKNVHLLFRTYDDLRKYDLESPRYRFASEICYYCISFADKLIKHIADNEVTAVFELLSAEHQHIEDFSHMTRNVLKFITWTSCKLDNDTICRVSPDVGIEIAKKDFDLDVVEYRVIPIDSVAEKVVELRKTHGIEGAVLYYIDSNGNTIGMLKKKTVWYIVVRAIREKTRNIIKYNTTRESFENKTSHRLREIQKWLDLSEESTNRWISLAVEFYCWVMSNGAFGDNFPCVWNEFLRKTGQTDMW